MTKFQAFKLRMSLLRIWALKNIAIFLEVLIFILVILILTGVVSGETPVLGILPGVEELSTAIHSFLEGLDLNPDFWTRLAAAILSVAVSTITFTAGLKRIALKDIKSAKLKRALIQAGLYFNKDGKLVKRIEEATKIDIDGDSKIGDTGESIDSIDQEAFIPGVKRAVEELGTIMTVKIDTVEKAEQVKEEQGLKETEKAMDAVVTEITTTNILKVPTVKEKKVRKNIMKKAMVKVGSGTKKVAVGTGKLFKKVGSAIGGVFVKMFNGIKKIFKKKDKKIIKPEIKVEAAKPVETSVAKTPVPSVTKKVVAKPTTTVQSSTSRLLSKVKGK